VNYDMSGTLLVDANCNVTEAWTPSGGGTHYINNGKGVGEVFTAIAIHNHLGGVNKKITDPTAAIVKSYSVNTSQGGAATFSLSGTIYDFGEPSLG
jgi:hypothetical protein